MITLVIVIILAALVLSLLLDAWPSPNFGRALLIVLAVVLLVWLFGGWGAHHAY